MPAYDFPDRRVLEWQVRCAYLSILATVAPAMLIELRALAPAYEHARAQRRRPVDVWEIEHADEQLARTRAAIRQAGGGRTRLGILRRRRRVLRLTHRLAAWQGRWSLTAGWCIEQALCTLEHWRRFPDAGWIFPTVGLTYGCDLAGDLLTQRREDVEKALRKGRGMPRQRARERIEAIAAENGLVRARRARYVAQGDDSTLGRSLEWLARCVAGERAPEVAASTTSASPFNNPHPTPEAVLISNKKTAALLGLDYRPRRGRPRKT
jgi:hypothetical protein